MSWRPVGSSAVQARMPPDESQKHAEAGLRQRGATDAALPADLRRSGVRARAKSRPAWSDPRGAAPRPRMVGSSAPPGARHRRRASGARGPSWTARGRCARRNDANFTPTPRGSCPTSSRSSSRRSRQGGRAGCIRGSARRGLARAIPGRPGVSCSRMLVKPRAGREGSAQPSPPREPTPLSRAPDPFVRADQGVGSECVGTGREPTPSRASGSAQ